MKNEKTIELPYVSAVIVAAGSASRMGGVNKQLLELCGVPVIARTLRAFQASELVREIIIVTKPDDIVGLWDIVRYFGIDKVKSIISGGSTRQKSVFKGILETSPESAYFAVHDGARPLIKPKTIDRVICDAFNHGAAAAGVKVKDTVKQVNENGMISATLDRNFLYNIQTPQVFEKNIYIMAMNRAQREGVDYTDDCQLIENMGAPVYVTESEYSNIKITTKEDVKMAERLLEQEDYQ